MLVAGKRRILLMVGNNDEVHDKKLNVKPKTTLHSGKSEASITIIKDSAQVIILLI